MQKYKKKYLKYHKIGEQDKPLCEWCKSAYIVDIHHLVFRSQGGKDNIENLIGTCRECHEKAHRYREFNEKLKEFQKGKFK